MNMLKLNVIEKLFHKDMYMSKNEHNRERQQNGY